MKKILSIVLIIVLTIPMCVIGTSAETRSSDDKESEVYYSQDWGGTLIRSIEGNKVIVRWIPQNSSVDGFTLVNQGGVITLNGDRFITFDASNLKLSQSSILSTASDTSWGPWQTFSERIDTGGLSTVLVAGAIATVAPWLSIKLIAFTISGLASSEYYIISGKMRYGNDGTYYYYERYTSVQNDNGTYIIKDHFDQGKERLE